MLSQVTALLYFKYINHTVTIAACVNSSSIPRPFPVSFVSLTIIMLLYGIVYQQSQNISGLLESEVYVFTVTAVNQVGESMINATTIIQTNESSEL